MRGGDKEALIQYRINRGFEALEEAKLLSTYQHWNLATSRLYYACFYALLALMAQKNINAYTHKGVKSHFHKDFIKTGLLSKADGKLVSDLFNKRHESDYEDFTDFDETDVNPLIPEVEGFLQKIQTLLKRE